MKTCKILNLDKYINQEVHNSFFFSFSDGQGVPYCDELTCTKSCNQYMNLKKGRCLENECFCENDNDVVEPTVVFFQEFVPTLLF